MFHICNFSGSPQVSSCPEILWYKSNVNIPDNYLRHVVYNFNYFTFKVDIYRTFQLMENFS